MISDNLRDVAIQEYKLKNQSLSKELENMKLQNKILEANVALYKDKALQFDALQGNASQSQQELEIAKISIQEQSSAIAQQNRQIQELKHFETRSVELTEEINRLRLEIDSLKQNQSVFVKQFRRVIALNQKVLDVVILFKVQPAKTDVDYRLTEDKKQIKIITYSEGCDFAHSYQETINLLNTVTKQESAVFKDNQLTLTYALQ